MVVLVISLGYSVLLVIIPGVRLELFEISYMNSWMVNWVVLLMGVGIGVGIYVGVKGWGEGNIKEENIKILRME